MRNVCWWFIIGNQLRLLWCHKATAAFGTTFTSVHQNSAVGTWLMYTHIPWILFSSVAALVHTTVAAPSGPCVSWLAPASASCSLQSALSWSRGSPFSRTWPQWFSWPPFLPCISSCQTTFPLPLSGTDVWGPFCLICPSPVWCNLPSHSVCSPCWEGVCFLYLYFFFL